jgi:hypothetical protein
VFIGARGRAWPGLVGRIVLLVAFYGAAFLVYSWPWARHFWSGFWCDDRDGLQNVWNLWWVRKAIVQEHVSPWFTTWLHFPHGTTLVGHTLNPWNGFMGLALIPILGLVRTYNLIVAASFAATGAFMALLARRVSQSASGALVAGFAFTFSGYHWAHSWGHLQLVSLEFVPLFLLSWVRLLEAPTVGRGVLSGMALGLVLLCDYYYFFYCCLTVTVWLLMAAVGWVRSVCIVRKHAHALLVFALVTIVLAGPFVAALLRIQQTDAWLGVHDLRRFSADPLTLIVPGGSWVLGRATRAFWGRIGDQAEHSIHIGLVTLALGLLACAGGRARRELRPWLVTGGVFFVLALGPALRVGGIVLTPEILPYHWLELLLPPLRLSGVPVRMMVMVTLVASLLAAVGWARAVGSAAAASRHRIWLGVGLAALLVVELWPSPGPLTPVTSPEWAIALRGRAVVGGVLVDPALGYAPGLYEQTIFEKPMAGGNVARTPRSVEAATGAVFSAFTQEKYRVLRQFGFHYLVTKRAVVSPLWREVWSDGAVRLYEGIPRGGSASVDSARPSDLSLLPASAQSR